MKQDEIISIAVQVGVIERDGMGLFICAGAASEVIAFAALVAEKATATEREACAQVCDGLAEKTALAQKGPPDDPVNVMLRQVAVLGHRQCAHDIRQRGAA